MTRRRLWDEPDQQTTYDPSAQQRDKAWRMHERYVKRFGPNYQKVLDERRAKRKRKAEAARQELADRTCSICGLVLTKPSAVKVHKKLEHARSVPAPYVGVLLNPLKL